MIEQRCWATCGQRDIPAGQLLQFEFRPVEDDEVPRGQAKHMAAPAAGAKNPAGHGMQEEEEAAPTCEELVPAGHFKQTVALAFAYEPASQAAQEVGETVAVEVDTEPGGHLMQDQVALSTKKPEGQGRQTELPVDEIVPRGQGRHDDSAVALGKEL